MYNATYLDLRVQRSLLLSPVPTLRWKKGTEELAPVSCTHIEAEEGAQTSLFLSPVPTLRQKKGTEKLVPVSCAHAEAEEGYREACSCLLCPR